MKRIVLFLATNLAVLLVLSIVLHLLAWTPSSPCTGSSYGGLLVFAALSVSAARFISLPCRRPWPRCPWACASSARSPPTRPTVAACVDRAVARARSGVGMPEVGIFNSPDPNAFATGCQPQPCASRGKHRAVAAHERQEIEAVLGHEMTHVANGDMVTLTLFQGVVNTFVIFLSRVIGNIIDRGCSAPTTARRYRLFRHRDRAAAGARHPREHDRHVVSRGAASSAPTVAARSSAGTGNMIAALEELKRVHEPLPSQQFAAFGIADGGAAGGLKRLFMSHPPLDERIAALRALASH